MTKHPTPSNAARAGRVAVMAAGSLVAAFIVLPDQAHAQAAPADKTPAAAKPTMNTGKIGIAPLSAPGLSAELRLKLEDAAAAGLRASGAEVMSSSDLSRARTTGALGACGDSACEQKLAKLTDTRYWLRGTVALDTSTYRIHLELTEASAGSVLSARDDTCDICTEAEAIEAVNMAASTLKAAAVKANLAAAPAPAGNPAAPLASSAVAGGTEGGTSVPLPDTAASNTGLDPGGSPRPMWLRVLPWVAFAGAAWALASGAYYWSIDGDSRPCAVDAKDCRSSNVTAGPEKYILTGAGVVLAATGVVLLLAPNPAPAATSTMASGTGTAFRAASTRAPRVLGVGIWGQGLALSGQF